jgi:hypothetical protein
MEEKNDFIEVKAVTPSFFRLFSSVLFDAFTVLLGAAIFSLATLNIYFLTPAYTQPTSFREETMLQSHLYVSKDGGVELLSASLSGDGSLKSEEKRDEAKDALLYCYTVYLADELEGKGDAKLNGYLYAESPSLFKENGAPIYEDENHAQDYFSSYCKVIEDHGVADLGIKAGFAEARQKILLGYFIAFLIAFSLSCISFLLVVPLCFKKGKRSFGMMLSKIAYLDQCGLSPSWLRFLFRFLFQWILILCGAFFTFGITIAFSASFGAFRKDHQSISDYVLGIYPVDASLSPTCQSEEEFLKGK